ncbi:hypothetical protein MES5069_520077 [Mesorhizobium escarrei]|uniref:Transposase n=1 Tax=Mesorhizobium escarrei TaxID=666018 RepID=A0ABM9EAX4_9HYPH|nr:hypothetical protein MES5069_520077 [Mesorhizobium escarrei]
MAVVERSKKMTQGGIQENGVRKELEAIFISVELSKKTWLVTSISPGAGERLSRHTIPGGDIAGLLDRLGQLKRKARDRTGRDYPFIIIQEAGLDGFWVHRVLEAEGHESHVVDAASIATSRRKRRVKTDRLDGETLIRALLAFGRGEPRVCSMLRVPTPDEEDRRRIVRERKVLMEERIRHSNRIKGLLFSQGISGYDPLRRDRRDPLETLRTGDGGSARLCASSTGWNCCSIRSRQSRRNGTPCSPKNANRLERRLCYRKSSASDRSLRPCCGVKACSGASTIAGRWRPMPALRRRHGKAGRSTGNRGSESPGIRACDRRCWKWRGSGCGTSPPRRSAAGSTSESPRMADASRRS